MLLRCRIALAHFNIDLDARFDARVTAIFGPSGSGKTTLLDAIAGLRPIQEGEIEIAGLTLYSSRKNITLPPQKRGIGYVPQEGGLFPHLTVRQNILFGARRDTFSTKTAGINLPHVAAVLEIDRYLDRPVTEISGGEAQRVALARAILSRPRLLLLDEPLAALDVDLKEKILPYLTRVRDEFFLPMIYVTHNMTEVLTLADWVLMLHQGGLVAQGAPRETLRSNRAISEIPPEQIDNVLSVTCIDSDAESGRTRVRSAAGVELFIPAVASALPQSIQVRISANDILLGTQRPEGLSAGNIIAGKVRRISQLQGQAIIAVEAGEEFLVRLTLSAISRLGLEEQTPVFLIMKTSSFFVV